jgi:hypothetical protein
MAYEKLHQPLASRRAFYSRLFGNVALALAIIAVSLLGGMAGYHTFEHESWLDAYADAAMILSGMGPLNPLRTPEGKIFAGAYALYSGLLLVATAGLILGPVLHRFLHRLHLAEEDETDAAPQRGAQ